MAEEDRGGSPDLNQTVHDTPPRNFMTSTPQHGRNSAAGTNLNPPFSTQGLSQTHQSLDQIQEILQSLPSVLHFLQQQQEQISYGDSSMLSNGAEQPHQLSATAQHAANHDSQPVYGETQRENLDVRQEDGFVNITSMQQSTSSHERLYGTPNAGSNTLPADTLHWVNGTGNTGLPKSKTKEPKERKTITTKTFAKGMMDVSLLTSNATQLRAVMSNPDHEFYSFLIVLIAVSVLLQIVSSVLLIMSDFYKTQVKEADRHNQRKRKTLNFLSLAFITIVTSLNILISAFYTPSPAYQQSSRTNIPQFSSATLHPNKHSEL